MDFANEPSFLILDWVYRYSASFYCIWGVDTFDGLITELETVMNNTHLFFFFIKMYFDF